MFVATMKRISLLERAHQCLNSSLMPGDRAIDATVGNGHDTLFLASCVGEVGRVYGFDLQTQAIDATQRRLATQGMLDRVQLIHACHSRMSEFVKDEVKGIMFNLGYLPGADKGFITRVDTSLTAVDAGCRLLKNGGVMTVLAYPGHAGGEIETAELQAWCQRLDLQRFRTELILSHYDQVSAPRLFVIRAIE